MRKIRISAKPRTRLFAAPFLALALTAWAALIGPAAAWAQSAPAAEKGAGKPPDESLTAELAKSRRLQIETAESLPEELKAELLKLYDQALLELDNALKSAQRAAGFDAQIQSAASDFERLKEDLEKAGGEPQASIPNDASAQQLEGLMKTREQELEAIRTTLNELEAERSRRAAKRLELTTQLEASARTLAELEQRLAAAPPDGEPPEKTLARRTLLAAQRQAIQQDMLAATKEIGSYNARGELPPLRRRLAELRLARADRALKDVRMAFERQRKFDVQEQLKDASRDALQAPKDLRPLADRNLELSRLRVEVDKRIKDVTVELDSMRTSFESLRDRFQRAQAKVENVGHSGAVGMYLRKERSSLPDPSGYRRHADERHAELQDVNFKLLELEDSRADLGRLDQQIKSWVQKAPTIPTATAEPEVRRLLERQVALLDAVIADYNTLAERLVDSEGIEKKLDDEARRFHSYIDERVLWIRSGGPIGASDLSRAAGLVQNYLEAGLWQRVGGSIVERLVARPWLFGFATAALAPLIWLRPRLRVSLREHGELAELGGCRQFSPTFKTLMGTLMLAALGPVAAGLTGWGVWLAGDGHPMIQSFGEALLVSAAIFFPWLFLRNACRPLGLAPSHLGWPESAARELRRVLAWLIPLTFPLTVIASTLAARDDNESHNSLGRICFTLAALLVGLAVWRAMRPQGGVLHEAAARHGAWLDRLRRFGRWPATVAPLALAALALWGYYYTARQLAVRLHLTVCLVVLVLLVYGLLLRVILIYRRRESLAEAKRRRAAALAADASRAGDGTTPPTEALGQDLTTISDQSRRLLASVAMFTALAAAWLVWVDVLPALRMFESVGLWQVAQHAGEQAAGEAGAAPAATVYEWITLADLAIALIVVVMTFIACRNLPGFLEILVLRRLPLDGGARFAISAMTRYVLIVVGLIWAAALLGVGWSKVQWLVAAISLGLGFGLQEIFANFVSGLIILMERPIRVGDVVTIGDTTGAVTRIQIRSTTITDWDRKELVVPNKDLITGRLINWTLSDQLNRLTIAVSVAYGSDPRLAREAILAAAQSHPAVLRDPAPSVTFDAFNDHGLNMTLRFFLPRLEDRLKVIDEMHNEIYARLRHAEISIAFPQRELRVSASSPLSVQMLSAAPAGVGGNGKH